MRRDGLLRHLMLPAFVAWLGGCALIAGGAPVPSQPPPLPTAQQRAQAARLQRDGLRAMNPPRGIPADPARASQLIEAAAELGDPDAQMLVAGSHLFRTDSGRDAAAALPWLHRAAQQGSPEAQYRLARLIEAGDGTPAEPAWAAVWFQRAAERGLPEAQFAMGLLQVAGIGTAADEAEALARIALAQRRGVAAAQRYRLALQPRVPPAQATQAAARIAAETAQGPVTPVDRPLVRFAQSALSRTGAWNRPVDGLDGPQTRAALVDFARRQGLNAAGPYDPVVIDRLRASAH
ncbi:SEL1-like repeat protein [Neoroseomonas lacus]|nr:SEL1-like repeat protein [Neoroseomonas lacus]